MNEFLMVAGFSLAAYAVVSNDSIQTLGTFLAANSKRRWWLLWAYTSSILVAVLMYSWFTNNGDPAYGRLEKFPVPENGVSWIHVAAPFALLVLTRFGIPVSTTFLVLSVFAPGNIVAMLEKSVVGYLVAFLVTFGIFFITLRVIESRNSGSPENQDAASYWIVIQWLSTAYLWSQWLIQDLANIFVFLPRDLDFQWMLFGAMVLVLMQGYTFYERGGAIQKILTSKQSVANAKAATMIDILLGTIYLVFKEWSNMPMSTTWVFLGLLAGRELAFTVLRNSTGLAKTLRLVGVDAAKAGLGLIVSIALAILSISVQ